MIIGSESIQEITFKKEEGIFPQKRGWNGIQKSTSKCAIRDSYNEKVSASKFNSTVRGYRLR